MPSAVRKRECRMANGNQGSYVVIDTNTNRQVSCHLSRRSANIAASIRDRADKLLKGLKRIVDILIKGRKECEF